MEIQIKEKSFEPLQSLSHYQTLRFADKANFGACNTFIGSMRDFNEGDDVESMTLEYYPGMTEQQLAEICKEAAEQWSILDILVIHRVGEIFPADPIVLVATWSSHRGDAFDSCRFIMEALKSKAPFWKKERLRSQTSRWVNKNSNGYQKS